MSEQVEDAEREILNLHIGSAGIDIGNYCWQLYCLEHHLDFDGQFLNESNSDVPQSFFSQENQNYRPQTFFIDHDSTAIDKIKTSRIRNFYNDNQFFVSSNSFDSILNKIQKQIETYDHFQGFTNPAVDRAETYGICSTLHSLHMEKNLAQLDDVLVVLYGAKSRLSEKCTF